MAHFNQLHMTTKGLLLLAKAQAGTELSFTRMAVGDGVLPDGTLLEDLTALINQKQSLTISSISVENGSVKIRAVLTNEGLETGFYIREIALFATDPDDGEILYCVANAGDYADYIPAAGGSEVVSETLDIIVAIENASSVTAVIPVEAYALVEDLEDHEKDYTLQVPYAGITSGSANTYTISTPTITSLTAGMAVSIKIHADSTGNCTLNWCGLGAKSIKKANGTNVTNLKAGGIYTLRYDGTNFILQGEGASGDATASDLLSGKTATTDAGEFTGTMPNNGAVTITPSTVNQTISAGYHNGSGYVAGDADLISANIKSGANIFGVAGNSNVVDTSAGDAVAAEILSGKKAYADGSLITGTISSKSAQTYTPGTSNQTIAAGQYLSGAQTITGDADLVAGNIKSGVNIFGVVGTSVEIVTALVAGDNVWVGSNGEVSSNSESMVKAKEIQVSIGGTVNIDFDLKCADTSHTVYGRVYINGVASGSTQYGSGTTYTTFAAGTFTVSANDLIQLYISTINSSYAVFARNFRLKTTLPYPAASAGVNMG